MRAKPNLCTPSVTIKYISRYPGRPPIAYSKIDHYDRHPDHKWITETIPALDFIQNLIQHIPEKHFKMLRYYWIYAKYHKQKSKLYLTLSKEKQLRWRESILLSFGYDPLRYPNCGSSMLVLEVYYKKTSHLFIYDYTLFCYLRNFL